MAKKKPTQEEKQSSKPDETAESDTPIADHSVADHSELGEPAAPALEPAPAPVMPHAKRSNTGRFCEAAGSVIDAPLNHRCPVCHVAWHQHRIAQP